MKILFLHLSDLHIKSKNAISKTHIDKLLDSLRIYGHFGKLFLILSGDIAFSGTSEQYSVGSSIVTLIFREIQKKCIYNGRIEIICVPGNHDIAYENPPRSAEDLNKIFNDFSYEEYLADELSKQQAFFEFSRKSDCFRTKSVFDRKLVDVGNFKIEINMVNSAVFSLRSAEDKGLHYIEQAAIDQLNTPTGAHFVISVMHHAPDWYIDSQKSQLETALLCKSSLIFFGHEHIIGTKNCSYNDRAAAFIHAGGALCNDQDWKNSEYEIGCLDTDTLFYSVNLFRWNNTEYQYEVIKEISKRLPSKPSIEKTLVVKEDYKVALFSNANRSFSTSSQDYYVFPRLEREAYEGDANKEFLDLDQFINEVQDKKRVLIIGPTNSGKTQLLKNLFVKFSEIGKCAVLCDIDTIKRKESSKIVKTNFEEIYGDNFSDYNRFLQLPPESKVLLIDDIDQIKRQDFENYISGQADQFGLMIFATKDVIDFDMLQRMKMVSKSDNAVMKYKILPFFADKRRELVERLVTLKHKKDPSINISETVDALCDSITLQKRYVTLEPEFIMNFVDLYCNNINAAMNSDASIFSKVFEANITTALSAYKTKELTVEKLYKLLSMLAHHIHFNKKYPISEQGIIDVVNAYNSEFGDIVQPLSFVEIAKKSKILFYDGEGYKFANRNHLAYFCAKEVIFLYSSTGKEEELRYLIEYCCFGINADVLMFISYITDNTRILQLFLEMTNKLTKDWAEFDFEKNCPEFLLFTLEDDNSPPALDSKAKQERETVELEKENSDKLQTIDIYDYKEDDIEKIVNQLIRSISLLAIVSKCLPGFEHNMNAKMRKDFVNEIYTLPNKIYSMWANEVDKVYQELIDYLKEQEYANYQQQGSKKEVSVEVKFKVVASLLLLDIYSISVNYATKDNSFRLLDEFDHTDNVTYRIQNLMMLERQKMSERFVHDSIYLHKNCNQSLPKFLIRHVVRYAYVNMKSLDFKMIDRLNSEFYQVEKPENKKMEKTMMIKRLQSSKKHE